MGRRGVRGGGEVLQDFKTILVSKCWKCWIQGHSQLRLGVESKGEGKTRQRRATSPGGGGETEGIPASREGALEETPRLGGTGGPGPSRKGLGWKGGKEGEDSALATD